MKNTEPRPRPQEATKQPSAAEERLRSCLEAILGRCTDGRSFVVLDTLEEWADEIREALK